MHIYIRLRSSKIDSNTRKAKIPYPTAGAVITLISATINKPKLLLLFVLASLLLLIAELDGWYIFVFDSHI